MLIEVSVLKNYPSSNLNRDNTGGPKTCVLGGINRGRISSQCLKYNLRGGSVFNSLLKENVVAIRTRKLHEIIWENLKKEGVSEEYYVPVVKLLHTLGKEEKSVKIEKLKDDAGDEVSKTLTKEETQGTSQIMSYSKEDISVITECVLQLIKESENVKKFSKIKNGNLATAMKKSINRPITLDIAMFGRMASTTGLSNIEAAVQVAHAVSTHKLVSESDYFTAVDDLVGLNGDSGSAMIGDVEFNSCCYFEYIGIDTDKLAENLSLNGLTENEVKGLVAPLIKAFLLVNPSGKQNSFAAHVMPEAVMIEIKDKKVPLNYSNIYSEPVNRFDKQGIVNGSIIKLVEGVNRIDSFFGLDLVERLWVDSRKVASPDNCTICSNINELLEKVTALVTK